MSDNKMAAVGDMIERSSLKLIADGASDEVVALASIAISMKRLADTAEDEAKKPKPSIFDQAFGER